MKVKFIPQNIELEIKYDQTVKELADQNGIYVKSICNGLPSCSECRVRILEGDHNVLPPSTKELNLIGTGYFIDQRRLSCQIKCFGDVTIDLSEQVEKQKNLSARKPHGMKKTETEVTQAVIGNFLDEDDEIKKMKVELDKDLKPIKKSSTSQNRNQDNSKPNRSRRFSYKPKS